MSSEISVCIITKNEERFIEKCLQSVIPIADEIVIMDTGSTDSTLEICRDVVGNGSETLPTIKIHETKWENDFSKARNECLSHAKSKWILFLDADEIISEEIKNNLSDYLKRYDEFDTPFIFNFKIETLQHERELNLLPHFRWAVFSNNKEIKFKNAIHEYLYNPKAKEINCPFFTIYHLENLRTAEELREKLEKYKEIILKLIENSPDEKAYFYLHLGNTCVQLNKNQEAFDYFISAYREYNRKGLNKKNHIYESILLSIINELIFKKKEFLVAKTFISELNNYFPDNTQIEIFREKLNYL